MDTNEVIFYTNHYKQSPFFDDTILRIAQDGFKFLVLLTGNPGEFYEPRVTHPNIQVIPGHHNSYDGGMMTFKQFDLLTNNTNAQYLIHIDNDCYLSDTQELDEYLQAFKEGGYGYVSHLCNEATSMQYRHGNDLICHVKDQAIFQRDPGGPPTPEPHYENAYQITLRKYYESLTVEQVGHHRRFIAGLYSQGAKMGAHRADYIHNYSSYGKEWFHLGLIMDKYMALENNTIDIAKYNPQSRMDVMRAGFFVAQEQAYGAKIYSEYFHRRLNHFYQHMGGKNFVYESWLREIQGTCMEHWQPL